MTAIKTRINSGWFKTFFWIGILILFLAKPFNAISQPDSSQKPLTSSDRIFQSLNTLSCTGSLGDPIVNFTFGSGPNIGPPLSAGVTSMQYLSTSCPNDGQYTITNYTSNCFSNSWHTVTDHTGDANGYFMLVNASYDPSVFYVQQVDGLCSGTTYQFSAWIVNVMNRSAILPNITFTIEKTDGTVLQSYNTGDIDVTATPIWKQYGVFFTTPAGVSSVVIRMKNNAPGGIGNDIGLDDIAFRPAGPLTVISGSIPGDSINVCNASITLTSTVETCYLDNQYQWQVNVNGNWMNIPGASTTSYLISPMSPGKYKFRLLVSAAGNIQVSNCRVSSNLITVVVVPPPIIRVLGTTICSGKSYTLPSSKQASIAGDYLDTVRYAFGCDSLITQLQLAVQSPVILNKSVTICQGGNFILPGGRMVSTAGIYHDTVRYSSSGCDSLISAIDLFVRPVIVKDSFIAICKGDVVTFPWGQNASSPGVYSDTARYIAGCDSLIKNVYIHVTVPVSQSIERFICPSETFTLPSGMVVNIPGFYTDTLRTVIGCDSIITFLKLNTAPPPVITLTKSNDVNCVLGISQLIATGGVKYSWSPAASLNNPSIFNPVASPSSTTTYLVTVTTALGCVGEDSIVVNVSPGASNPVQLPNAFTPNGDGLNDCFGVRFLGAISNLKLSIYDRWGNRVFYTNNPSQCWDGNYRGKQLKSDVFIYQMSATTTCGDVVRKGTVTLIR